MSGASSGEPFTQDYDETLNKIQFQLANGWNVKQQGITSIIHPQTQDGFHGAVSPNSPSYTLEDLESDQSQALRSFFSINPEELSEPESRDKYWETYSALMCVGGVAVDFSAQISSLTPEQIEAELLPRILDRIVQLNRDLLHPRGNSEASRNFEWNSNVLRNYKSIISILHHEEVTSPDVINRILELYVEPAGQMIDIEGKFKIKEESLLYTQDLDELTQYTIDHLGLFKDANTSQVIFDRLRVFIGAYRDELNPEMGYRNKFRLGRAENLLILSLRNEPSSILRKRYVELVSTGFSTDSYYITPSYLSYLLELREKAGNMSPKEFLDFDENDRLWVWIFEANPLDITDQKVIQFIRECYALNHVPKQYLERQVPNTPRGFTYQELIDISSSPVFNRIYSAIQGMANYREWNYSELKQIVDAQGPTSFMYISRIRDLIEERTSNRIGELQHAGVDDYYDYYSLSPEEQLKIVQIAKMYGPESMNILTTFIDPERITEKEDLDRIDVFLEEVGIADALIFRKYINLKQQGKEDEIQNMIDKIMKLAVEVRNGKDIFKDSNGVEDYNLRLAVLMYCFPPAVGVNKDMYGRLMGQRKDTNSDVPQEIHSEIPITVSTMEYKIDDSTEFDMTEWQMLENVIRGVHQLPDPTISRSQVMRVLISSYEAGSNQISEEILLSYMYRLHLSDGGGELPERVGFRYSDLMQYKEFIGARSKQELLSGCVQEFKSSSPEEYAQFLTIVRNRTVKARGRSYGMYQSLSKQLRSQSLTDLQRSELVQRIEDELSPFGLTIETAETLKPHELRSLLSIELDEDELVVSQLGKIMGSINYRMSEQMRKFKSHRTRSTISPQVRDLTIVSSKKVVHSVAGLNMGVCVAADKVLWEDPHFWNVILFDPESQRAMGGMHMMLVGDAVVLPGINPSIELLEVTDNRDLLDKMLKYAHMVRETLGLERVLIPINARIHSNREQIGNLIFENRTQYGSYSFPNSIKFDSSHGYEFQECYEVPKFEDESQTPIFPNDLQRTEVDTIIDEIPSNLRTRIDIRETLKDWEPTVQIRPPKLTTKAVGVESIGEPDPLDALEVITPIQHALRVMRERVEKKEKSRRKS